MDLAGFYAACRRDGHGRAAHDPAMMVALLLYAYAYATARRSSRAIERACVDDVAVRVVAANQRPDHCTIARFRQRHEAAPAGLFGDVLALCAGRRPGWCGGAAGGRREGARERLAAPEPRLRPDRARNPGGAVLSTVQRTSVLATAAAMSCRPELATEQGRRGWLREAKRRLDEKRAAEAKPIAKSRAERLREGKRRLQEDHDVHCRANEAYEAYRARG